MSKSDYILSVSEPWDFEGPDGENVIYGRIVKEVTNNCLIFESNNPVSIDNVTGSVFVAFGRHDGYDFEYSVKKDGIWSANIGLYTSDDELYLNMNSKELMEHSKYVIIGSVKKLS
ncbi:MAG: hypothetical protein KDC11_00950 [Chitinophagaceae bacterium]|nr:hypothetical protein [Chitinophagaceae bacterium]